MSLTTRSNRPHARETLPPASPGLPSARRSFQILLILAVPILSACADSATEPLRAPSSANADRSFTPTLASVDWQAQARLLVAGASLTPIVAGRDYALLGVAQYGAVVDADKNVDADGTLQENGQGFGDGGRRRFEARRGAVAAASADILWYLFFPTQTTMPAQLAQRLLDAGNAGPGGVHPYFTRGVAIGHAWGAIMKRWAGGDGFTRTVCTSGPQSSTCWPGAYPTAGTGVWITNPGVAPAGPQFGAMKPYFMTSPAQFHPAPPPAVGSLRYNTDLAEVSSYAVGVGSRTADQLADAVNLNLPNGTITPLGKWDEMATAFIAEQRFDERAAAHVFALTNAAAMDAVIGCWEAKYTYYFWRPWAANTLITSLPIGKPNHSSYPSGHSCVSAASADVLKAFFPEPEHVAALEDLVVRNGNSRIYAGIHFRFDVLAGQALGRSVAATALAYDRDHGLLAAVR